MQKGKLKSGQKQGGLYRWGTGFLLTGLIVLAIMPLLIYSYASFYVYTVAEPSSDIDTVVLEYKLNNVRGAFGK